LQSEYALNYPVENFHGEWTAQLPHGIVATNAVEVVKIYQQAGIAPWNRSAYPVWSAALLRDTGRIRPYLRLGNLSNTGYEQIDGVAMPGRSIAGGISLWLGR
jgi:iron complex outermembrane receptor protein